MISYQNVGARDTKYIIQSSTYSSDSLTNEKVISWSTLATVWGENLKPLRVGVNDQESRTDEIFEADQQIAKKTIIVRIKYIDGVTATCRMIQGSEIFYIVGVDTEGRQSYLILTAEQRDDNLANDSADIAGDITVQDEGVTV